MIVLNFFVALFAIFLSPHIFLYYKYKDLKYSLILIYGFIVSLSVVWLLILLSYYLKLPNIIMYILALSTMFLSLWYMYHNRDKRIESMSYAILWILALTLLLPVFQHIGSGFTEWDALVSWNRWGLELYNNEYHPINAAYPVLIPALYAIFYKIQGTNEIWWTAKIIVFILPLFVLVLPMVLYREYKTKTFFLITLLIYPYLLMPKVIEGAVDMPVMIMGMCTLIVLYAAEINKENRYFEHYAYAALLLAGLSSITKQGGLAFVVFVVLYMFLNLKYIESKKRFILVSSISLFYFISFLSIYYLNATDGATGNLELLKSLSEYTFAHKELLLKKFFMYPPDIPIFEPLVRSLHIGYITPYLLGLALMIFLLRGTKKYNSVAVLSFIFLVIGFFAWGKYASYHERNSYWVKTFLIMLISINFNYFIVWYKQKKMSPVYIFLLLIVLSAFFFANIDNKTAYETQKAFQAKLGWEALAKDVAKILTNNKSCVKLYTNDYALLYNYHTKDVQDRIITQEFDVDTLRKSIENNCSGGVYLSFRGSTRSYSLWKNHISRLIYDEKILPYKGINGYLYHVPENTLLPNDYFDKRTVLTKVEIKNIDTNITFTLESIEDRNESLMIKGWAFVEHTDIAHTAKYIVLKRDSDNYVVVTNTVMRPDVANYFKAKDIVRAGFKAYIYKKDFKEDEYTVYLLLIEKNGKQHLIDTKKKMMIKHYSKKQGNING